MTKQKGMLLNPAIKFVIKFLCLFGLLYGFFIFYIGIISPGGKTHSVFLETNFNFISWLRYGLIESSSYALNVLGYYTKTATDQMLVVGRNIVYVGYDCLGFGVMSFFTAFVLAYPANLKAKAYFLIFGLITIQTLNLLRFIILSIYWRPSKSVYISDHHTIFNLVVYIVIAIAIYFYTRLLDKTIVKNAKN